MIRDNHSEYDRNKTGGVPRPGKALLHGLVHCGECGHKMVVQYKGGTQYLCNSSATDPGPGLPAHPRRPDRRPRRPPLLRGAGPGGTGRLRPGHGLALRRTRAARAGTSAADRTAPLSGATGRTPVPEGRSRQPAGDRRTGEALGDGLAGAEASRGRVGTRYGNEQSTSTDLDSETRRLLTEAGRQIPEWWRADRFSREQKKALLRCLIDKVVVHRSRPGPGRTAGWSGKGVRRRTPTSRSPSAPGRSSRLAGRSRNRSSTLARQGKTDEEIAHV